jgi:hypothetical protein
MLPCRLLGNKQVKTDHLRTFRLAAWGSIPDKRQVADRVVLSWDLLPSLPPIVHKIRYSERPRDRHSDDSTGQIPDSDRWNRCAGLLPDHSPVNAILRCQPLYRYLRSHGRTAPAAYARFRAAIISFCHRFCEVKFMASI